MARTPKSSPEPVYEAEFQEEQDLIPNAPPAEVVAGDDINLQVQQIQTQLLVLKRQQEEVERQKKELEELSRKQHEFDEGRREIVEKLTRGLVLLERQEFEAKRELEQIKIVRDSFAEHLGQTENLNPTEWSNDEMPGNLNRALARVDEAKNVYNQSRARLSALRQHEGGAAESEIDAELAPEVYSAAEKPFLAMVRDGFAYSLPLIAFSILALIAYLLLRH